MKFDQAAPTRKGDGAVKVISTVAQKGGSGKSAIADNLAAAAANEGFKVALVDFNSEQGTTTDWLAERVHNDPSLVKPIELLKNVTPSRLLATIAQAQKDGFDYIFIDTEPRMGMKATMVVEASDFVLIPTTPSPPDVDANRVTMQLCADLNIPSAVVMTKCSHVGRIPEDTASYIEETLQFPVAPEMIIQRTAYSNAYVEGKSVIEYAEQSDKATASDRKAATEIMSLFKWVDQEIENERKQEPALREAG